LVTDLVGKVAAAFLAARIPGAFVAVEEVVAGVLILIEASAVEDEELKLGAEVRGIGNARLLHVIDGLARDEARIAAVVLPGQRILDAADKDERGFFEKRVDEGGLGLGNDEHVGFVDGLPAADGG